jgi:hypothetical protein
LRQNSVKLDGCRRAGTYSAGGGSSVRQPATRPCEHSERGTMMPSRRRVSWADHRFGLRLLMDGGRETARQQCWCGVLHVLSIVCTLCHALRVTTSRQAEKRSPRNGARVAQRHDARNRVSPITPPAEPSGHGSGCS